MTLQGNQNIGGVIFIGASEIFTAVEFSNFLRKMFFNFLRPLRGWGRGWTQGFLFSGEEGMGGGGGEKFWGSSKFFFLQNLNSFPKKGEHIPPPPPATPKNSPSLPIVNEADNSIEISVCRIN